MASLRMVHLMSASSPFEARLLAARLGAEGVLWELRGGGDGPYPVGGTEVLVAEDDLDRARDLLLSDEVEAAFGDELAVARPRRWLPVALAVLVVAVMALRVVAESAG